MKPARPSSSCGPRFFITGIAYFSVAMIQRVLDGGTLLSVLWQLIPYALLTTGEVLLSVTGLEFAYTQAPREMKGTIMSLWNLTVTIGNLLVALVAKLNVFESPAASMTFYGALICVAGVVFWVISRGYTSVEYYQAPAPTDAVVAARTETAPVSGSGKSRSA